MKRGFISLAVGAALTLAPLSAMAADDSQPSNATAPVQSTLAAGPAAGTEAAQGFQMGTLGWVAVGVAAAVVVAVAASGNGGGHNSVATTTSTTP
jgi:hypothetical protein